MTNVFNIAGAAVTDTHVVAYLEYSLFGYIICFIVANTHTHSHTHFLMFFLTYFEVITIQQFFFVVKTYCVSIIIQ